MTWPSSRDSTCIATRALESGGCDSSCSTAFFSASRSDWPPRAASGDKASITTGSNLLTWQTSGRVLRQNLTRRLPARQQNCRVIKRLRPHRPSTPRAAPRPLAQQADFPAASRRARVRTDFSSPRGAQMDEFDRQAARCVFVGIQGTTPTPAELDLVRRGVGGVILFARNVVDPTQVAELSRTLKSNALGPLLICIDQEGGRVQRLRPPHWTAWPSMRRIGEIDAQGGLGGMNGAAVAETLGKMIAQELSACGIDLDFAPVLDVDTNPRNPVIGDRSFSRDPRRVARLGVAFAQALERAGVASCGKHFPGHGDTSQDSHMTLPRLAHDPARLWEVELVPFVAAARAAIASVMTAHIRFETLDRLPATLSPVTLGMLRKEVGFRGCCISDDLEMQAISENWGVPDAAELAIDAGCDAVLVCHTLQHQHDSVDAIARGARSGPMPRGRLEAASSRVQALQKFARPASAVDPGAAPKACNTEEHRRFATSLNDAIARSESGAPERRAGGRLAPGERAFAEQRERAEEQEPAPQRRPVRPLRRRGRSGDLRRAR